LVNGTEGTDFTGTGDKLSTLAESSVSVAPATGETVTFKLKMEMYDYNYTQVATSVSVVQLAPGQAVNLIGRIDYFVPEDYTPYYSVDLQLTSWSASVGEEWHDYWASWFSSD